jgi:peptidoglycan/LPS O-acetylase OafA/YrhL
MKVRRMSTEPALVSGSATSLPRLRSMDALRAFLVAWIIAGHALLGYSAVGGWAYAHIAEVRFAPRVEWVLAALIGPTGVFLMGTFFLIAGMFTSVSLAHREAADFLLRRLTRLGLPFAVTVLSIWPATEWLAERATGGSPSYLDLVTGSRLLHAGAMWFVGVLLVFSVAYLALFWLLGPSTTRHAEVRVRHLVWLTLGIAAASFAVRLRFPAHGREWGDLHVWEWPQLASMFVLGIVGGREMATRIPDRVVRRCNAVTLSTVALVPVLAVLFGVTNVAAAAPLFKGGWHWQAALLALVQAVLVVAGSASLVAFAQRHVDGSGPVAVAAARASYAAFMLQNPTLMVLALAVRPVPAPAELKAPVVAVLAVGVCFLLGHVLVTRTPMRRVL